MIKPNSNSPIDVWAFTESANTHPLPFKVIFEPRLESVDLVKDLLEDYGT